MDASTSYTAEYIARGYTRDRVRDAAARRSARAARVADRPQTWVALAEAKRASWLRWGFARVRATAA